MTVVAIDLTGQRFGRLTVLRRAKRVTAYARWRCRCYCGKVTDVDSHHLRKGMTVSCGCYAREVNKTPVYKLSAAHVALLGTMPDPELARRAGVTSTVIRLARKRRKIKAWRRTAKPKVTIGFVLSTELRERIATAASRENTTIGAWLRSAAEQRLDRRY